VFPVSRLSIMTLAIIIKGESITFLLENSSCFLSMQLTSILLGLTPGGGSRLPSRKLTSGWVVMAGLWRAS
jgi:hypothetical protein